MTIKTERERENNNNKKSKRTSRLTDSACNRLKNV
jgi:hypothetical protein